MPRADVLLVELAHRGAGDVVDECPVVRSFPHLHLALESLPEGPCGGCCARLEVDQDEGAAAPAWVGYADHGGLGDAFVADDGVFEFDGRDQFAPGGDDVVDPVHHVEVSTGGDRGHVSGAEPAVDEPFGGLVGEITGGDPRSAQLELADRHSVVGLDVVAVDHSCPDPGGEAPLPEQLGTPVRGGGVWVGPCERDDGARFREPVRLQDRHVMTFDERVEECFGDGGAAHDDLGEVTDGLRVGFEPSE